MKAKDALVAFLFWLGILAFVFFVMTIDSIPQWIVLVAAAIAWSALVLIFIRDRAREKRQQPQFWVRSEDGELTPLDNRTTPQFYDQEADK